uniref:Putative E3 ubiquitin-protein ligase LUL3 n=1 Tax=Schistocephalus solidus TaxID=70667 RepID=A0A0X3PBD2_SCHSO
MSKDVITADTPSLISTDGGSIPLFINALALCIFLFSASYLFLVFFWKFKHEATPRPPPNASLTPLENNVVITKVAEKTVDPGFRMLAFNLSVVRPVRCFVLKRVPLEEFHSQLVASASSLLAYLNDNSAQSQNLTPETTQLSCQLSTPVDKVDGPRQYYDAVLAFHRSQDDTSQEFVELSIYVIHVKHRDSEQRPTQVLYAYCKTNWSRLINVKLMYAASVAFGEEEGADAQEVVQQPSTSADIATSLTQLPNCVVCLSERSANYVLLPCRHVALCRACTLELTSEARESIGGLQCPICRRPVYELRSL